MYLNVLVSWADSADQVFSFSVLMDREEEVREVQEPEEFQTEARLPRACWPLNQYHPVALESNEHFKQVKPSLSSLRVTG